MCVSTMAVVEVEIKPMLVPGGITNIINGVIEQNDCGS